MNIPKIPLLGFVEAIKVNPTFKFTIGGNSEGELVLNLTCTKDGKDMESGVAIAAESQTPENLGLYQFTIETMFENFLKLHEKREATQ